MNTAMQSLRKSRRELTIAVCVVVSIACIFAFTQGNAIFAATGINNKINFQGKLVNPNGTNVADGSYTIVFSLYQLSSGGTALWTETQTVTTTDGVFRVSLGSVTPIPSTFNFNWDGIYLGIKVGSDSEMTPRIQMAAVPYAFNAQKVSGLTVQDDSGNASTSATLRIANNKTVTFTDSNSLTFNTSATTNVTIPSGTITLVDLATTQTLTSKTIGSTGLVFSGATTDITTVTNEDLSIVPNGSGNIGLGTTSPLAKTHIAATTNSKGALLVTGDGNQTLFTASISGTPTFTIDKTGAVSNASSLTNTGLITANGGVTIASGQNTTLSSFTTNNNSVLYTGASGVVSAATTTSTGLCLVSNGSSAAPTWSSCPGGGGSNYWRLSSGAFSPVNDTADLLIGNSATTSAKFAFTGVAGTLTPVASISGTPSSGTTNGLALGGDGTIQSLNRNNLTLGGSLTGDIVFKPGNATNPTVTFLTGGAVGIGTSLPDGLQVNTAVAESARGVDNVRFGVLSGTPRVILEDSGSTQWEIDNSSGSLRFYQPGTVYETLSTTALNLITGMSYQINNATVLSATALGAGVTTANGLTSASSLATVGALTSGSINWSGSIATSGNISTSGTGTITSAGLLTASNAFTVTTGNITFSAINSNNNSVLYTGASGVVAAATTTSTGLCLVSNGSSAAPTWSSCPGSGGANYWRLSSGAFSPVNDTADLLIGSTATTSAKFAVLNINSGTPTASISGNFIAMPLNGVGGNIGLGTTNTAYDITFGNFSNRTIGIESSPLETNGKNMSVQAGTGGAYNSVTSAGDGGKLTLQGGNGGLGGIGGVPGVGGVLELLGGSAGTTGGVGKNGGNIYITGGAKFASGTDGSVILGVTSGGTARGNIGIGTTTTSGGLMNVGSTGQLTINSSGTLSTTGNLSTTSTGTITSAGLLTASNAFTVTTGNITLSGFTTNNNSVLYTGASGVVGAATTTSSGQCLTSNGSSAAPTWGSCGSSGGSNWTLDSTNGVLRPNNNTLDLLIGGTATTSAKFAVLNVNSGTTVASVSGNLVVMPRSGIGGNVGIGTTNPTSSLYVAPTVTASGGIAQGVTFASGTLIATANNDSLRTVHVNNMTFSVGALTGISGIGLDIDPTTFSKSGGGTIANTYGLYVQGQSTIGTNNYSFYVNSGTTYLGGNVGVGTTAPTALLDVQGIAGGNAAARIVQNSFVNTADIFTASQSSTTRFKIANNGDITATSSATTTDAFSFAANTLTTGTGFRFSSTTTSTSAFKLASIDWSPGSSTIGTGDLLSLNMGANALGAYFLNLKDNGTSVFSVSQTQFTTSLPTAFTAPGDVANAYDLIFTNPTASYIKSSAPLTIQAGETFNSSDLTLQTFNMGNIVLNPGGSTWISAGQGSGNAALIVDQIGAKTNDLITASASGTPRFVVRYNGSVGIGTSLPAGMLHITGIAAGNAIGIFNQANATSDIFTASSSGATKFVIQNSGNVGIGSAFPRFKLDVTDSQTSTYSAVIATTSNNAAARALGIKLGNAVPTSNQRWIDFMNLNGGISGKIIANGAGSPTLSSVAGDYAEYFHKDDVHESMPVGTLVCLLPSGKVTSCSPNKSNIIGIVSDSYIVLGRAKENPDPDEVIVGLLGQLPVFVSTENGAIQAGDFLTTSSKPGIAMKATGSGYVIGKALASYSGNEKGKIDVLASALYKSQDPESLLTKLSVANTGDITTVPVRATPVPDSLSSNQEKGYKGLTFVQNNQDVLRLLDNVIQQKSLTESKTEISEFTSDRIIAGLDIVTPQVVTQDITLENIHPRNNTVNVILSEEGKVNIGTASAGVTFDALGNGNFAGTLRAKHIKAETIEGLEFITAGIDANQSAIASLSAQLALLSTNASAVATHVEGTATTSAVVTSQTAVEQIGLLVSSTSGSISLNTLNQFATNNGLVITSNATFKGSTLFEQIAEFFGQVVFRDTVTFEKTPVFNKDVAGGAVVVKDADSVTVLFDQEYPTAPFITANINVDNMVQATESAELQDVAKAAQTALEDQLLSGDIRFIVTNRTTKGFTIKLNKPAEFDIPFSWSAVSVKDAHVSVGLPTLSSLVSKTKTTSLSDFMKELNKPLGVEESSVSGALEKGGN